MTGEVKPASFGDALNRGLSVDRMAHISAPDLQAKIESKVARDKEQGRTNEGFSGVVTAKCRDVRACVMDDGRRSFCAYDTSAEGDVSHADVCQAVELPSGTSPALV